MVPHFFRTVDLIGFMSGVIVAEKQHRVTPKFKKEAVKLVVETRDRDLRPAAAGHRRQE
jgi:hypothetical protein